VKGVTVLEIGSSLREARIRRGLELAQVDADTHIRTRYLQALEDDRFELLPGVAYVRGFLRTYADYLGLDADLFVDEYNARFAPADDGAPELTPLRRIEPVRLPVSRIAVTSLVLVLVAVLVWRLAQERGPTRAVPNSALVVGNRTPQAKPPPARSHRVLSARLALTASRGPCWLLVRIGSAEGRFVHEGMLDQGQSLRFDGRRLWLRLGAPQNLDATVNGDPARLPGDTADVLVTAAGVRMLRRG
jgi:cytoskeleton protein RodZ